LYILAGIRSEEDCACVVPPSWNRSVRTAVLNAARPANGVLRLGRLHIIDHRDVYAPNGDAPAVSQLTRTTDLVRRLARHAKVGARVVGYPGEDTVQASWWWEYEERVTPVLTETGVTALCVYDPADGDGAVWRRAELTHPYVAKAGRLSAGGRAPGPPPGPT
jgi:hypothetical protein